VPAAAVIPAPIAYIKIVAVKKLVVGFLVWVHLARFGYGVECRFAPAILLGYDSPFTGLGRNLDHLL